MTERDSRVCAACEDAAKVCETAYRHGHEIHGTRIYFERCAAAIRSSCRHAEGETPKDMKQRDANYRCGFIDGKESATDTIQKLERELSAAHASLSETTRIANEEMDRHKRELAASREAVREACAKVCDDMNTRGTDSDYGAGRHVGLIKAAKTIRALDLSLTAPREKNVAPQENKANTSSNGAGTEATDSQRVGVSPNNPVSAAPDKQREG